MASNGWTRMPLGQFVTLQRGHDLPDEQRRPGSVPILGSFGITGWHDEPKARGPGVTVGRSGASFGVVSYSPVDYWPLNTALYVTDFHGNDERFAYYFLKLFDFQGYNSGSAQPSLNRNYVHPVPVDVPPVSEQRAIAHILGTLDDKIELNRRMNETLEAMARAIFKSWFVDAIENGIPEGWKVAPIGDCVSVFGGSTPSTDDPTFWDGEIHFVTPKDLASLTSPVLLETERRITKEGLARISSGLLPRGTVLLSSRAPIGYLAISEIPVAVNQGFIAMVCDRTLPNHYVLHWARQNMDIIIGNANGTTFLEISKRNFRPIPVIVPPPDVLKAFVTRVEPLHMRIVSNLRESRTLAALRDSLLPKLISGELRVPDAERIMGRTAA